MLIKELFVSNVTRDIPPVVYFHEQTPEKLAAEVGEYIITGGWPDDDHRKRRVPDGIHEQYVRLLKNIVSELDKPGGVELPTVWISGFYGSGKSSFAKLLGLALDGVALPNGKSLAEALLDRDSSPRASELRDAWKGLRAKLEQPVSVVFDVGGFARDNEQLHAATLRQVQKRLGYCSTDPLVADFELKLERDGEWSRFEQVALETLGQPWSERKDRALAEDEFSLVMSVMFPERYTDPTMWYTSRAGMHQRSESPEEAVAAIRDMLQFRCPNATLFIVVDEVSQYVHSNQDRIDRLRAFCSALGANLRGKVWLMALGQQKIDDGAGEVFLSWAKDRFPQKLRVHLEPANIRDVVHRRLLKKTTAAEAELKVLFERHRTDLKLFAYNCESITAEDFIETYPLLPGHIDLLLTLTSAMSTRSNRAQGDAHAIRGLLQLLGELFRGQKLAERSIGTLITLDQIYEVQHTALDADTQSSMARIVNHCAQDASGLRLRVAKAVALLELIQETTPTDAALVSQCLFDRLDRGSMVDQVTAALEQLRAENLLGYSEKQGYKVQSSAGEEWERERRDIPVGRDTRSSLIHEQLRQLMSEPERPSLKSRPFVWAAVFSDGLKFSDDVILETRDDAAVRVDFRLATSRDERQESQWIKLSNESALVDRVVWVSGATDSVEEAATDYARSDAMIKKYKSRSESLSPARKMLLVHEEVRLDDLKAKLKSLTATAWMEGRLFFRGRAMSPTDHGTAFASALTSSANRLIGDIFPHFEHIAIGPTEVMQLLERDLTGPSPKLLGKELGILDVDAGKYVPSCAGVIPKRILSTIEKADGVSGSSLITEFGKPPYGFATDIIKACVAGLLRASKVRIRSESGDDITAIRDAGSRDVFDKDRSFRRAEIFPAKEDAISPQTRARICKFFSERLGVEVDRDDNAIADELVKHLPGIADRLNGVLKLLNRLPNSPPTPPELQRLATSIEQCLKAARKTTEIVKSAKKHLDALQDGVAMINLLTGELTEDSLAAVRSADDVLAYQARQLEEVASSLGFHPEHSPIWTADLSDSKTRIEQHLAYEKPWRDIRALDADLQRLREAYSAERAKLLRWQEQMTEQARNRLKAREGFSLLTADQSHRVLRPFAQVTMITTPEAISPSLAMLKDPFEVALRRADEEANDLLDKFRSDSRDDSRAGDTPPRMMVKFETNLRNREINTEAELEAVINELRARILEQLRNGVRVRLQ